MQTHLYLVILGMLEDSTDIKRLPLKFNQKARWLNKIINTSQFRKPIFKISEGE